MKFKAVITESSALKEFQAVTASMSKFAKDCIMRITQNDLYFIISEEETGPRRPLTWCQLPAKFYFREYKLVGVLDTRDEIFLEFSMSMFSRALKTSAKCLKIKLTNKQIPCITVEVEQFASDGAQNRQYIHDIPVEVINMKHWDDYSEPVFTDFHVTMQMPVLKPMRNIVDSMKNMSHSLIVSANKNGRLTLSVKTNMVEVSAHFPDMSVESFAVGESIIQDSNDTPKDDVVNATVDIKKFLLFLTGMQPTHCKSTCSIIHNQMVKLLFEQPGSYTMQCFLTQLSI